MAMDGLYVASMLMPTSSLQGVLHFQKRESGKSCQYNNYV